MPIRKLRLTAASRELWRDRVLCAGDREDHHAPFRLEPALEAVAEYGDGDRVDGLKRHVDPALDRTSVGLVGAVTLRKRRLPAERILRVVVGMEFRRDAPIVADPAPIRDEIALARLSSGHACDRCEPAPSAQTRRTPRPLPTKTRAAPFPAL